MRVEEKNVEIEWRRDLRLSWLGGRLGPSLGASSDLRCHGIRSAAMLLAKSAKCQGSGDSVPGDGSCLHEGMKYYCIDRHDGAINCLFMDWAVRGVGLEELWTPQWYVYDITYDPWTKAGGVQPEDWPAWMRKFRDYGVCCARAVRANGVRDEEANQTAGKKGE